MYETRDFPDLPHLAHLLESRAEGATKIIIDCTGVYTKRSRSNTTANHWVKLNGHEDWEWIEGFTAVASHILQTDANALAGRCQLVSVSSATTLQAVALPYSSPEEAAKAWGENGAKTMRLPLCWPQLATLDST